MTAMEGRRQRAAFTVRASSPSAASSTRKEPALDDHTILPAANLAVITIWVLPSLIDSPFPQREAEAVLGFHLLEPRG